MLILRNIVITILLLCLTAISVVGIMVEAPPVLNWTPDRLNQIGHSVVEIMRPGLLLFLIWIVILLSCLLVFFITVARPRRRMKIEVQMGGGRVVIMDAAIKKYIRNALAELNEVTVKKIDLREQRGQVTTDIYADVRTRQNLPTLERLIISRVRSALAEDLGITNLGDVHVYIKNFEVTGRPIKPAPEPAEQPEPAAAEPTDDSIAETNAAIAAAGVSIPAATLASAEPVIGGEQPPDAEHAADDTNVASDGADSPLVFPAGESAIEAPDESAPAVTETDEQNEIVAEKPLPAQDDADAPVADTDPDHKDLDEPLAWDLIRPREESETDDDKKSDGEGGSRPV